MEQVVNRVRCLSCRLKPATSRVRLIRTGNGVRELHLCGGCAGRLVVDGFPAPVTRRKFRR